MKRLAVLGWWTLALPLYVLDWLWIASLWKQRRDFLAEGRLPLPENGPIR